MFIPQSHTLSATATYSDIPWNIHESLRATFVPLPCDPAIPLTLEQLQAVFPHTEVWRDMIAFTLQQLTIVPAIAESSDKTEGQNAV